MNRSFFIAPAVAVVIAGLMGLNQAHAQYSDSAQQADNKGFNPINATPLALAGPISHGTLLDLDVDDHLQYALLAGRAGGQILSGGTNSADALALQGSTANDGNIILNALGGNVGIGTGTPMALLDVNGNANITGNLTVGGTLSVPGSFDFSGDLTVDGTVFTHFVNGNSPLELQTDGVTRIYIDDNANNGHVGVGNPPPVPPAFPLDVNGDIHTNAQLRSSIPDGTAPLVVASMTLVTNLNADKLDGFTEGDFALLPGRAGGQILNGGTNAGDPLTLNGSTTNDGDVLINPAGGNVGIMTATPGEKLDVVGGNIRTDSQFISTIADGTAPMVVTSMTLVTNFNADKLDGRHEDEFALLAGRAGGQILNGGTNNNDPLTLNGSATNDGNVLINPNGGNVGIMTATPGEKLDVVGGNIRTDSQFISTIADGTAPMVVTSMTLVTNFNADKLDGRHEDEFALLAGRAGGQILNGGTNNNDPLTLNGSATNDGNVLINPNGGNVGIMTATPGEKLDVVGGNIRTDSQFISTIPDGTPPLVVDSMTVVTNLNADKVDGRHENEFALLAGRPGGQILNGGDGAGEDLVLDSTSDPMKGFVILNPTPVGPGTGSVGIGTMNPTEALEVIGCIKADCLKITAPSFVGISPLGMVRAGTGVDLLPAVDGTVKIRALVVSTHSTMIPVDLHTSLFGAQQKLVSVDVQYKLSTPNSFLSAVRARVMGNNGAFVNLAQSAATPAKSTAWATHTITPVGGPIDITGPLYLNFEMNYTGINSAHDIQIGKITITTIE